MRTLTAALCLGLAGLVALPAQAAEVAVLDWRQALMETEAAQRSMNQFRNRVHDRQQEAEALGQELQGMQQRLQEEGELMAEAERRSTLEAFRQKGQRFEQLRQSLLQERQQAEQAFLEEAEPKLDQAVQRIIERHDVEVLVNPRGVVHAEGDLPDLTGEVTEILDSLY
ncbi:OmpH/Skp family outer membrane protein [Halomonas koreensis]|uniref:OmpH family outer membrane protein n=1 Tax=Halomonas koreensis TaxID=245385 RepID=A0ABU1G3B6_9GAMM|nr:OmpH family outer membrane protein [Halomonas koreensis]MDR5867196.1 OmpH family outer membrane protein [Halomonas koreensis]